MERSRQRPRSTPLWNGPAGPSRVARAGGGVLGAFIERYWVSLRTTNATPRFVVLRLEDEAGARRAIVALEERTDRRADLVSERDRTK